MVNKCLKITLGSGVPGAFLRSFVLKHARQLGLEGVAQAIAGEGSVRIIVCGDKDKVEDFLDALHKGTANFVPDDIEVEPFLKDKDYRGVFRVIE